MRLTALCRAKSRSIQSTIQQVRHAPIITKQQHQHRTCSSTPNAAIVGPRRHSIGADTNPHDIIPSEDDKTSLVVRVNNTPGALEQVLKLFRLANRNLTRIESRPMSNSSSFDVFLDMEGKAVDVPFEELRTHAINVQLLGPLHVPWFPRTVADLDTYVRKTLEAGDELQSDHPGFSDLEYRSRRETIVNNAKKFRHGDEIPHVTYTEEETRTWGVVFQELTKRYPTHACDEYKVVLTDLINRGLYKADAVPQLEDLAKWLMMRTGVQLRPVAGLLSGRDFLNGLALRVFHSTQYIRHPSRPYYTPEPDCIHELMGHVPLLGDEHFAALNQEIGLASLGASDAEIIRLATLYWFTVEFGVLGQIVGEHPRYRAYGAGLLSSFGELEHAISGKATMQAFDPDVASVQPYPITTFQPTLFVSPTLQDVVKRVRKYCEESMRRPFHAGFKDGRIVVLDRSVRRVV